VNVLEIRGLTKRFHEIPAVDNVSFTALPGQVTGYLGPNGSGKSTTVKILCGLLDASEGEILWRGAPVRNDWAAFKARLGYVPEEPYLYPYLTGGEYLELVGELREIPTVKLREKIGGFLDLLGLYSDRFTPLSAYSKGMRQKVLIAAALMHDPDLVILDEPFSGLDVNSALMLRRLIRSLAEAGKVVLFSSHELDTVEKVSSRVVILYKGKLVANDSVETLRELMSLPNLEEIFRQLAVEQDTDAQAQSLMQVMQW
jgi:ABC-2 type transport system ATP-binding protein